MLTAEISAECKDGSCATVVCFFCHYPFARRQIRSPCWSDRLCRHCWKKTDVLALLIHTYTWLLDELHIQVSHWFQYHLSGSSTLLKYDIGSVAQTSAPNFSAIAGSCRLKRCRRRKKSLADGRPGRLVGRWLDYSLLRSLACFLSTKRNPCFFYCFLP